MYKIGEFARLGHVTIKTLRFYAREGLLTPVYVDRFSGYRYYTSGQLPVLNRIMALKDLGFSLDQIRRMLGEQVSAAELRGMLRMKAAELRERVNLEQQLLQRVEDRLHAIEQEASLEGREPMLMRLTNPSNSTLKKENEMDPIKFVTLPAFKVMGMKYHGNNANQEIAQMWGELNQRAGEIPMTGECAYGVCLMLPDAPAGLFEYVAGFKVENANHIPAGMVVIDVPENQYAVFAHRGLLDTLGQTYQGIVEDWLPRSGYTPVSGYDMEVYTEEWKGDSPDSVFYIYEPVK